MTSTKWGTPLCRVGGRVRVGVSVTNSKGKIMFQENNYIYQVENPALYIRVLGLGFWVWVVRVNVKHISTIVSDVRAEVLYKQPPFPGPRPQLLATYTLQREW